MRKNKTITPTLLITIIVYFLSLIIWGVTFFYGTKMLEQDNDSRYFLQNLFPTDTAVSHIITFFLMLLNAILLRKFNEKFRLIRVRTFLPELVYVVLITSWLPLHSCYMAQISLLLILVIISIIFDAYWHRNATENAFLSFFLISILILILPEWIVLVPFLLLFFYLLRSYSFKVFLASILGTLPIFSFIFVYNYFLDDEFLNILNILKKIIEPDWIQFDNLFIIIYVAILLLLFVLSFFQRRLLKLQDRLKEREYIDVLRVLVLAPTILIVYKSKTMFMVLPLLAMIYSFLFSYSISLKKSWLNKILFYLFVIVSFIFPLYLTFGYKL